MTYVPARKGTLLIPSGPEHDLARKHLFVVCTDACKFGKQVIVPIASRINDLCDATCILQPHEHTFLKRESFVLYRKARIELQQALISGIQKGVLIPKENMNDQTFLRIYNGIYRSDETIRKVKTYLTGVKRNG